MAALQESGEIFLDETVRKPNRYAANVLVGVVAVIAFVCLMNEIGVFDVDRGTVQCCLLISVALFVFLKLVMNRPRWVVHPASKYMVMGVVLLLVLALTVLLNIHAVLAYVLPLLLATQYRSFRVSRMALFGSILCCAVAPVLSYLLRTWSLSFMIGYIQTFCRVTVSAVPGNGESMLQAILQITLYWSLPQMLTLAAFGIILFSVTKTGIDSVHNQVQVMDLSVNLSQQLASISTMQEKVLYAMSDIIENRDLETGGHVRRTSQIVRLLMDAMRNDPEYEISDSFYNNVIKTAPMHDIGKIAIPDAILRKPDKLTEAEYRIVMQHPEKSAEIIQRALTGIEDDELLLTAKNIALYHHERVDGAGYPEGLKGEDIPLEARIMAIADVYDALVNKRCYKEPMAFDQAFATVEGLMGSQFDPELNRYFVACRPEIEAFYKS